MRTLLMIVVVCLPSIVAITCDTCKGEKCMDHSLITPETCPQGIHFCYMMTKNDKLFDAGCAVNDFCAINKVNGAVCGTCDSDRCNTFHLPPRFYGGGGDAWNGMESTSFIMSLAVIPLAMLL